MTELPRLLRSIELELIGTSDFDMRESSLEAAEKMDVEDPIQVDAVMESPKLAE